ncbi:MAG: hypothetical protein E7Z91_05400 [Cyanobacteria bacterium SIG30]|nr:hypothetical protein [Cyanobacteria bacterium SIG30]
MSLQNSLSKFANNLKTGIFNRYANNTDKFLLDTAAIGWGLAAAANIVGVTFNKKIDPKEKKYLIPQELADGVTNVGLFYVLTHSMIKGARKLVDKGIIDFDKSLPQKDIIKARHGVAAVASLLGAVVSSNIITPIVRNNYASYMQKRYLKAVAENKTVGYTLPMFKDSYKNPITMNSFLAFTNRGNLKI